MPTLSPAAPPDKGGRERYAPGVTTPYGVLAYNVAADPTLKASDKLLVAVLPRYGRTSGRCFPSVATLAAATALSERTVQRALRRLELAGWLRVEPDPTVRTGRRFVLLWLTDPARHPQRRVTPEHPGLGDTRAPATVPPGRVTPACGYGTEEKRQNTPAPPIAAGASSAPAGERTGPAVALTTQLARQLGARSPGRQSPAVASPAPGSMESPPPVVADAATGTPEPLAVVPAPPWEPSRFLAGVSSWRPPSSRGEPEPAVRARSAARRREFLARLSP